MLTFYVAEVAAARLCMRWKDIVFPDMGEHSVLGDVLTHKLRNGIVVYIDEPRNVENSASICSRVK